MATWQPAQLLRLYMSEQDKHQHQPLYEALAYAARQAGLSGATITKGGLGFGAQGQVESAKLLTLAENLPLALNFVDSPATITRFLPEVERLFSEAGSSRSARCKPRIINYSFYDPHPYPHRARTGRAAHLPHPGRQARRTRPARPSFPRPAGPHPGR